MLPTTRRAAPLAFVALAVLLGPGRAAADPIVFEVGGNANPASIQGTVDAFRMALGNPNNANDPGPLGVGRREINWDGGGATARADGGTPFLVFQDTRGATFTTPGTGFTQSPITNLGAGGVDGH
jgi:hypothetical protein